MISIKRSKNRLVRAVFGCFFGILGLILPLFANNTVFADEIREPTYVDVSEIREENREKENEETAESEVEKIENAKKNAKSCDNSLGSLGWLVCPATGKISEATDWLYEKNKDVLEINPVKVDENEPIYQIWNYCLGLANIAFVIFLLIVIYSQITGVGITNYGIKKALPKLIIAAIIVNLSFIICSLAVDVSNIIGGGLRGIFENVAMSTVPDSMTAAATSADNALKMGDLYGALGEGTLATAFAGTIIFEGGEIWLLIPAVLGAIVAVVVGLITIALRQVVVILLIMISPLAIVATILPNTESLFRKWKDLFVKMLVFYPMYSLLFGASALAGWAIIATAHDGFGLILGTAVQIFPLFFSWSLMKMSGTFLGTIHAKLTGLFVKPLATNRAWAESHRELTRQKMLASSNVYTPSAKLRQFINDRKIAREAEIKENIESSTLRGNAYATRLNYNKDGSPSKEGEEAYARLKRNIQYQNVIDNSKADFEKGLGQLEATKRSHNYARRKRLEKLDVDVMNAADESEAISARMELIKYQNAKSRFERMNNALDAHMDDTNGYDMVRNNTSDISVTARPDYKFHFEKGSREYNDAIARYARMSSIMEGNIQDTQYVMANSTHSYDTQKKIFETKMQKLYDNTVPTKDLENRLNEFTKEASVLQNIDAVIAGLRILNQRGDTDLVKDQLDRIIDHGLRLGTHASQAIASFLMFEVKDSDPFLRRFGKYINLETARMFNENERKLETVTFDEYVKGYHMEPGATEPMYAKKGMINLMEGTSLDGIERTALPNFEKSIRQAYTENGVLDEKAYLNKLSEAQKAVGPQFISANQKFLSGSEQIASSVSFITGYTKKQVKDRNGHTVVDEHGTPIYEWKPKWEGADSIFQTDPDEAEKHYRSKTEQYIKDQTPGQILGLRSDYYEPLLMHLSKSYIESDDNRRIEHERAVNAINAQYTGKARDKAIRNLLDDEAGERFREILLSQGNKIDSIEKSKRSGAANNAKDWVRKWLLLDGTKLKAWINSHNNGGQNPNNGGPAPTGGPTGGPTGPTLVGPNPTNPSPTNSGTTQQTSSNGQRVNTQFVNSQAQSAARANQQQQQVFRQQAELQKERERKLQEEIAQQQRQEADPVITPDPVITNVYTNEDAANFADNVENIWYDYRDEEAEVFFQKSYEYVAGELGKDSYIPRVYREYYKQNNIDDSYELREYLTALLSDLNNYA